MLWGWYGADSRWSWRPRRGGSPVAVLRRRRRAVAWLYRARARWDRAGHRVGRRPRGGAGWRVSWRRPRRCGGRRVALGSPRRRRAGRRIASRRCGAGRCCVSRRGPRRCAGRRVARRPRRAGRRRVPWCRPRRRAGRRRVPWCRPRRRGAGRREASRGRRPVPRRGRRRRREARLCGGRRWCVARSRPRWRDGAWSRRRRRRCEPRRGGHRCGPRRAARLAVLRTAWRKPLPTGRRRGRPWLHQRLRSGARFEYLTILQSFRASPRAARPTLVLTCWLPVDRVFVLASVLQNASARRARQRFYAVGRHTSRVERLRTLTIIPQPSPSAAPAKPRGRATAR